MPRRTRRPFPRHRSSHGPDTAEQTWLQLEVLLAGWATGSDPVKQDMAIRLTTRFPVLRSTLVPRDRAVLDDLVNAAREMRANLGAVRRRRALVGQMEVPTGPTIEGTLNLDPIADAALLAATITLQTLVGTLRRQLRSSLDVRTRTSQHD